MSEDISRYTGRTPRSYKPFTPGEDARIMDLRAQGWGSRRISREIGRTEGSVGSRIMTLEATGDRLERCRLARASDWPAEEDALLLRLRDEGVTYADIARDHLPKRTPEAIRAHMAVILRRKGVPSKMALEVATVNGGLPADKAWALAAKIASDNMTAAMNAFAQRRAQRMQAAA